MKPKFLIIEDNVDQIILLKETLKFFGFEEIEYVHDGQSALNKLNSSNTLPDIILLDVELPDIPGYILASKFKSNPKLAGIPILAVSAHVMNSSINTFLEAGCDDYIGKPYDFNSLKSKIDALI